MTKKGKTLIIGTLLVITGFFFINTRQSTVSLETVSTINTEDTEKDLSIIPVNLTEVVSNAISRQSNPNTIILDVRTDSEWDVEHAKGATHWGLAEYISKGEMPNLEKDTEIFVYCRSGSRAGQAIRAMQKAGFTNLTNIRGLEDWREAGGETVSGQ